MLQTRISVSWKLLVRTNCFMVTEHTVERGPTPSLNNTRCTRSWIHNGGVHNSKFWKCTKMMTILYFQVNRVQTKKARNRDIGAYATHFAKTRVTCIRKCHGELSKRRAWKITCSARKAWNGSTSYKKPVRDILHQHGCSQFWQVRSLFAKLGNLLLDVVVIVGQLERRRWRIGRTWGGVNPFSGVNQRNISAKKWS